MLLVLIAAAAAPTAVDAERAFARDAQRMGQWTAFARYADKDAVMFTPQAVWARDFLKGRKNLPKAVQWWPAQSIVSCDGRTAINSGPWRVNGRSGEFTTVWQRQKQGWRWVYDGGDDSRPNLPIPKQPKIVRASCNHKAPGAPIPPPPALTAKQASTTPTDNGRGQSADKTLGWDWKVQANGTRLFRTYLWNGRSYRLILDQKIAAK
ncbi:MAG: hypothetical protein ABIQ32_05155 [Sphingomicrobium sp.]